MAVQEDRGALRRALGQTIPALTVVEVASRKHARAFAEEMKALVAGRPCETLDLIAEPAHANSLIEEARRIVSSWPADEGVLFLVDETPGEAGDATEFWRTLNLQREQWGSLAAHVVFVLRPDNYRLLLRAADHLATWMPLKFDLREPPEPWGTLQQETAMAASSGKDTRSSRLTLRLLEEDLNDYFARPEQDQRILLHRFYLPMAKAALDNARVAVDRKIPERACEYARHARDIARKEGDAAAEANALVLLGGAYQSLPRGDRGANLEQAIGCYEAALRVFTEAAFAHHHAMVNENLAKARAALAALHSDKE
jgi:tetratricopeptide (TPR) repeat protein